MELEVARWRRYGKDRLYVKDTDGEPVGWVDLLTGERTLTNTSQLEAFDRVVDSWYAGTAAPAQSAGTAVPPAPRRPWCERGAAAPPEEPNREEPAAPDPDVGDPVPAWHDLAANVPGQAARLQAARARAAMRERTRVGTFLARAFDLKTDERAWRVGADGEETVGGRLEKLTKHGWHVLHAVPVGTRGSDIDHVVIGPGGVYTINTKRHPGGRVWVGEHAIKVNGQSVPYLRNSRFEAQRAEKLLSSAAGLPVPVRPVLVFLTGTLFPNVTIKQRPADVVILDRMDIPGAFTRAPERLSAEQTWEIYEVARRCTTWTRSAQCCCSVSGQGAHVQ